MKQAMMALSAIFILSSCNNNSSSGNPPKQKSEAELIQEETDKLENSPSAVDMAAEIKPDAFKVVKENLSYQELEKFKTVGCSADGTYRLQRDPELKIGSIFREQSGSSESGKHSSQTVVYSEIKELTDSVKISNENYEFFQSSMAPATSIQQLFSAKPHFITKTIYNSSGSTPTSEHHLEAPYMTPAGVAYFQNLYSDSSIDSFCSIKYDSTVISTPTVSDEISYPVTGRYIAAVAEKRRVSGMIVCEIYNSNSTVRPDPNAKKIELGRGSEETLTIYSNELVQKDFIQCGRNAIYTGTRMTLDSGRVISSRASKTLTAPFRP